MAKVRRHYAQAVLSARNDSVHLMSLGYGGGEDFRVAELAPIQARDLADELLFAANEVESGRRRRRIERGSEFFYDPATLADLLQLVQEGQREVTVDEIAAWDKDTRCDVADWAIALHLLASDNDDVEVPELPEVLRPAPVVADEDGD